MEKVQITLAHAEKLFKRRLKKTNPRGKEIHEALWGEDNKGGNTDVVYVEIDRKNNKFTVHVKWIPVGNYFDSEEEAIKNAMNIADEWDYIFCTEKELTLAHNANPQVIWENIQEKYDIME